MEQRPLRLGDIVDDYCPRERRITNHAIVAIVNNTVRQTRCTTCDSEHVYKQAKVPRRRKSSDLTADALAGGQLVPPPAADQVEPEAAGPQGGEPEAAGVEAEVLVPVEPDAGEASVPMEAEPATNGDGEPAPVDEEPDGDEGAEPREEVWSMHRPLIRATLPRLDGEPPPQRPIPEFTMHQRQARGGQGFRHGQGRDGNGQGRDGNGQGRDGNRQGRAHHGNGNSSGQGRPRRGRSGRNRGHHKRHR